MNMIMMMMMTMMIMMTMTTTTFHSAYEPLHSDVDANRQKRPEQTISSNN